jgi:hypothetical protein
LNWVRTWENSNIWQSPWPLGYRVISLFMCSELNKWKHFTLISLREFHASGCFHSVILNNFIKTSSHLPCYPEEFARANYSGGNIEFFLSHATFEHFFTRRKKCDKSATLFVMIFQFCFAGQFLLMEGIPLSTNTLLYGCRTRLNAFIFGLLSN